jgi:lipoprotein-anchoring transpeptidase ErfK/SrfK
VSSYDKKVGQLWLARFIPSLVGIIMGITVMAMMMPTAVLAETSTRLAQKLESLKKSEQRWLEIDLSEQQLTAWQGATSHYQTIVSTGKTATPTHSGIFSIQRKLRQDRMRGADYDVPNVPHVMYYHRGYAIHGAYWHNQFGTRVSHGCINLPLEAAEEIYEWTPMGIPVVIHQ